MNVYVATSWRNPRQQEIVKLLRAQGYDVYDFRDPSNFSFHWRQIDRRWRDWTPEQCRAALDHGLACKSFSSDKAAMEKADVCVLVQPCGRSAHLEAGWFGAQPDKRLIILLADGDPESMFKLADALCVTDEELLTALQENGPRKIDLPDYCHPMTGHSKGGDEDCDHDYPPESKVSRDEYVYWTCSKCGMRRYYEVYD